MNCGVFPLAIAWLENVPHSRICAAVGVPETVAQAVASTVSPVAPHVGNVILPPEYVVAPAETTKLDELQVTATLA